jgi:(1->4)-alpha-D-glucan 1-alpha-D-glucosylmutase
MLRELRAMVAAAGSRLPEFTRELTATKEDGRIKLYLTYRALQFRREHPALFTSGEYLPAETSGTKADHVFGFVRRHQGECAAVAVPRLLTGLVPNVDKLPSGRDVWQDTVLQLPDLVPSQRWRNIFTGEILNGPVQSGEGELRLAEVFAHFPVALLLAVG